MNRVVGRVSSFFFHRCPVIGHLPPPLPSAALCSQQQQQQGRPWGLAGTLLGGVVIGHLPPPLPSAALCSQQQQQQGRPWGLAGTLLGGVRGIRVSVRNGNLDQALAVMNRKMQSSGMERLLRRARTQERHLKNSEKRVLARKNLERRIRAQEFHKKLRQALVNKLRVPEDLLQPTDRNGV